MQADGTSTFWVADATLNGGGGGCPVAGAANGRIDRTVLVPAVCANPPTGHLLGVERPPPLAAGTQFGLVFHPVPSGVVAVFGAYGRPPEPEAAPCAASRTAAFADRCSPPSHGTAGKPAAA